MTGDRYGRGERLRAALRDFCTRVGGLCINAGRKLYLSPAEQRAEPWFAINGDRALRLAYDLAETDTVFDLGAYEGQWTSDIFAMYGCAVHAFEPVPAFAEQIKRRFIKNRKITVHPFGLAAKDETVKIRVAAASSSIFGTKGHLVDATLVDVARFLERSSIRRIDLMKINIEGAEYDLLERLISIGALPSVRNIQVQFHDFIPDARRRMESIQNCLAQTHRPTYQYEFVWENWEAKQWPPSP